MILLRCILMSIAIFGLAIWLPAPLVAFDVLPRAGVTQVGTPSIPEGGLIKVESQDWEQATAPLLVDSANGHGFLGTRHFIIKIALGSGATAPTRLSTLHLPDYGGGPSVLLDDEANGVIYVGIGTIPITILKVDKGVGSAAPTILESTILRGFDSSIGSGAADFANGVTYFTGVYNGAPRFFKVKLNPVELVGGVQVPGFASIDGTYIDPAKGIGFAHTTQFNPSIVHKFNLGATVNDPPSLQGSVTLEATDYALTGGYLDSANDLLYLVTGQESGVGRIIKMDTGGTDNLHSRLSAFDLATGENAIIGLAVDAANNIGYLATRSGVGRVIKLNLGAGATAPSKIGTTLQLSEPETYLTTIALDPATSYLYTTTSGAFPSTPQIVKVNGGIPAASPTRTAGLALGMNFGQNRAAAFDHDNGYMYTVAYDVDGMKVMKLRLHADPTKIPERINVIEIPGTIMEAYEIAINTQTGYGYAIIYNRRILKFRLGVGDAPCEFVGIHQYGTEHGATPYSLAVDPSDNMGYIGTYSFPGQLLKVDLGTTDTLPSVVSSLVLDNSNSYIQAVIPDFTNRLLYLPGQSGVGKVAMGDGTAPPTYIGRMAAGFGDQTFYGGALDLVSGYGYFSCQDSFGARLVKAALNDPSSAPTRLNHLSFSSYTGYASVLFLDPVRGVGYVGSTSEIYSNRLSAFIMGAGTAAPTSIGYVNPFTYGKINGGSINPSNGVITLSAGYGSLTNTPRFTSWHNDRTYCTKTSLSRQSDIKTFNFYSHHATGKLRFAIYKYELFESELVWESAELENTVQEGWITVPIAGGSTDTLVLDPGEYWLSWQTDSPFMVGSYRTGSFSTGANYTIPYGNFSQYLDRPMMSGKGDYDDYNFSSYVEHVSAPVLTAIALVDRDLLNTPSAGYTNENTVDVNFTYTNGPVEYIHLSEDDSFSSYTEFLNPIAANPIQYTFNNTADGSKTLYARMGNYMGSSAVIAGSIIVDTVPPVVTANSLLTNNRRPAISGTASDDVSLLRVSLVVGGQSRTATLGSGTWSLSANNLSTLSDGEYDILATAVDRAGNATLDSSTNELEVDGTGPVVAAPVGNGGVTHTNNTTVTFAWSEPTDINGLATLTLQVGTFSGGTSIFNSSVLGQTQQSVTGANGQTLYARLISTDSLGNSTTGANGTITVDTVAPNAPTGLDLNAADDSGVSNTDNITNVTNGLTIRGTAESQSTVHLYHGATQLTSGTSSAFNSPGLDIALPADGVYTIQARATDRAGNQGAASSINVTIDTTPPTVNIDTPTTQIAGGNIVGNYTISDSSGITGTQTLYIRRPGMNWGSSLLSVAAPSGSFSYLPVGGDGPYHFLITATDGAGNSISAPNGNSSPGQSVTFFNGAGDGSMSFSVTAPGIYIYPLTATTWVELDFVGLSAPVTIFVQRIDAFSPPSGYSGTIVGESLAVSVLSGTLTGSVMVRWHVDPSIFATYGGTVNRVLKYNSGVLSATYPVVPGMNPVEFGPLTGFSDFYLTEENVGVEDWSVLTD